MLNFVFYELKMSTISIIRILKNNQKAINYNKMIGYKLLPNQDNVLNQLYQLNIDDYKIHGAKLNNAAAMLNKGNHTLRYYGEVCAQNIDEVNQLLNRKHI